MLLDILSHTHRTYVQTPKELHLHFNLALYTLV